MEIFSLIPLIYAKLLIYTLAFTRIAAFLNAFILFRRWVIAQRTILSLSSILAVYAVMIKIGPMSPLDDLSFNVFSMMIMQSLIGVISAVILNIIFEVFFATGQLITAQIGLSLASQFDPRFGNVTNLTQFYIITATLIFFSMNGHLFIIKMIVDSFQSIPVDQTIITKGMLSMVLRYSEDIFNNAMLASMTIITTMLVVNVALAFVTKFASQFNIFSVGINISLIIGLIAIYLTYQAFINFTMPEIQHGLSTLMRFYRG